MRERVVQRIAIGNLDRSRSVPLARCRMLERVARLIAIGDLDRRRSAPLARCRMLERVVGLIAIEDLDGWRSAPLARCRCCCLRRYAALAVGSWDLLWYHSGPMWHL